jgi:SPP1 family predicted phage head-tail adaptor
MKAGSLVHRVTYQTLNEENVNGQIIPTFVNVGTFWALVQPLSGRELIYAQSVSAEVTHKITMRHNCLDISPKDRLIFGGRKLNIQSAINVDEQDDEWLIMAVEDLSE